MNPFKMIRKLVLKPLRDLLRVHRTHTVSHTHITIAKNGKAVYNGKELKGEDLKKFREGFRHIDAALDHVDEVFGEVDQAFDSLGSISGQKSSSH